MKAGFAKVDITPPLGCVLNGYYTERYADRVIEPLYAIAVAYSDGQRTAVTVSLDISEILQRDTDDIRRQIAQRTGLPFEAIFVACIHTHTAPVISEIRGFFKRDPDYYESFCRRICDCVCAAMKDMTEAEAFIARNEAKGISFVRRFRMKNGQAITNPSHTLIDQIEGPIGTPDETVQLVRLKRPGAADIAIVNFGTHPDVLGGTGICPDWPGFLRNALEGALTDEADGKGVHVIFFNGAQGDVIHLDRCSSFRPRGVEHSRHMGRVLAGAVLAVYSYATPIDSKRVFFGQVMTPVAVAKGTDEQVRIAAEIHEKYLAGEDVSAYPFDIVMARKYLRLEHCDPTVDLNVVCVGFGDVAFVGLPGEPFTDIGREIKTASPFAMTLPCCNANGSEGYFPTDAALNDTGYESNSSLFLPGVAPRLIRTSLALLKQLKV
ncbi:MAG: hypothetical protein IJY50_04935 [Clostridia bacterium]|nr:hypothetical protein [Clostridia bacterium]